MKNEDVVTMFAVGDIVVARKDWQSSFARVESFLKKADVSFFNCETPYAESGCPNMSPHGAIPHDPKKMPALASAGFNVCSLANNHCLNWGVDALVECRERLEAMGMVVCGAGRNIDEARKPAIVERKGVKVAFLGYCSVGPNWTMAEENKPGSAMVRIRTLYEPYDYQPGTPHTKVFTWAYKEDLDGMVEDIKKAKERADIVVVTDHWGVHHIPALIPDYGFEVGHAAVDAGADLVLGTHPHILKGIEVYKGKVIMHSMANFVMERSLAQKEGDQPSFSLKYTKQLGKIYGGFHSDQSKSLVLKCIISGAKIERVSYIPVMLVRSYNPEVVAHHDSRAEENFKYVKDITASAGLATEFSWDGNEVVIST